MTRLFLAVLLASLSWRCLADGAAAAAPASPASSTEATVDPHAVVDEKTLENGRSDFDCQLKAADAGASSADCGYTMYWAHDRLGVDKTTGRVALQDFEGNTLELSLHVPQSTSSGSVTLGNLDGLAQSYTVGIGDGLIVGRPSTTLLAGVSAKGGVQKLAWLDAATMQNRSRNQGSWAFGGYFGGTFGAHGSTSLTGFASVSRSFKDAKGGTLCHAAEGSDPLLCATGPIGPPSERRAAVTSLRWAQALSDARPVGYAVMLSHDWRTHISGVDVPVSLYQWTVDKSSVTLGFDVSWTDDPASTRRTHAALVLSSNGFKVLSTGN